MKKDKKNYYDNFMRLNEIFTKRKTLSNSTEKVMIKRKKLKIDIISKIKNRSHKKSVSNEISKDIEKTKLEPKNLIIMDYINKKLSKS